MNFLLKNLFEDFKRVQEEKREKEKGSTSLKKRERKKKRPIFTAEGIQSSLCLKKKERDQEVRPFSSSSYYTF